MGQPVVVSERPSRTKDVVRFELNRSLTGMGHERYRSAESAAGGVRPPDVVAQRLFERGGVKEVHVFSNVVTVHLDAGANTSGIKEMLEKLYVHYLPGVKPTLNEDGTPSAAPDPAAADETAEPPAA